MSDTEARAEAAAVAEHYNQIKEQDVAGSRKQSPIYRLRKFNNWVKTVLISLHTKPGYTVLDLACGKGGDLGKYKEQRIGNYVGCDVAIASLSNASVRYNELPKKSFPAKFLCGDCFDVKLSEHLNGVKFDFISCQFAMHYAFHDEGRVRMLLKNICENLKAGGFFIGTTTDANVLVRKLRAADGMEFGNSVYKVIFDDKHMSKSFPKHEPYGIGLRFTVGEQVDDCHEYMVHWPSFVALAEQYGLHLMLADNLHQFYKRFTENPGSDTLKMFERMVMSAGGVPDEEWDAVYLYMAFAFQKIGKANPGLPPEEVTVHGNWEKLNEEDIVMMQAPRAPKSASIKNIID